MLLAGILSASSAPPLATLASAPVSGALPDAAGWAADLDAVPFQRGEAGEEKDLGFSPSLFKFVTTVPDDGKDDGGGAQQANAELKFWDWRKVLRTTGPAST